MTQSFEEEASPTGRGAAPADTDAVPAETETVPEVMVAEFSSLTTAYCWVITEDLVAGYDGAVPSVVGMYGPPEAGLSDLHEALCAGRWFRLAFDGGAACAVGRIYDPSRENDRAPLDELGLETWAADAIEYRQGGKWEPA
jgi:hypothetical protein